MTRLTQNKAVTRGLKHDIGVIEALAGMNIPMPFEIPLLSRRKPTKAELDAIAQEELDCDQSAYFLGDFADQDLLNFQ